MRREELLEARPMEEGITGEAARVRDERNHAARGSKDERKRRDETLAIASVEEDWQGMVAPDPASYLKDNGQQK
jgi:hypothetical protein